MVETAAGATACVPSPSWSPATTGAQVAPAAQVLAARGDTSLCRSRSGGRAPATRLVPSRDSAERVMRREPNGPATEAATGDAPPPSLLDVLPAPGKVVLTEEMLAGW